MKIVTHPDNWSYTGVPTDYLFDRGFTGHEHLDAFNLINMNGRMYDPLLASFLSPDPFINPAEGISGYNGYNYVTNNPLHFVDLSGFWKGWTDLSFYNQWGGGSGPDDGGGNGHWEQIKITTWWLYEFSFLYSVEGGETKAGGLSRISSETTTVWVYVEDANGGGNINTGSTNHTGDAGSRTAQKGASPSNKEVKDPVEKAQKPCEEGNMDAPSGKNVSPIGKKEVSNINEPFYLNHEQTKKFKSIPGSKITGVIGVIDYFRSNLTKSTPIIGWILAVYTINSWMLNPQIERVYDNYTDRKNHEGVNIYFNAIYDRYTGQTTQIIDVYDKKDNYYCGSIYY